MTLLNVVPYKYIYLFLWYIYTLDECLEWTFDDDEMKYFRFVYVFRFDVHRQHTDMTVV